MLSVFSPLAIVDNMGMEVGMYLVDLSLGVECVTSAHKFDEGDRLLVKGVSERNDEFASEWVIQKVEFGMFLGLSYDGFEDGIKELFKSIESRKRNCEGVEGHKLASVKCLKKELKKLESSANYDRKESEFSESVVHGGGGGMDCL